MVRGQPFGEAETEGADHHRRAWVGPGDVVLGQREGVVRVLHHEGVVPADFGVSTLEGGRLFALRARQDLLKLLLFLKDGRIFEIGYAVHTKSTSVSLPWSLSRS